MDNNWDSSKHKRRKEYKKTRDCDRQGNSDNDRQINIFLLRNRKNRNKMKVK